MSPIKLHSDGDENFSIGSKENVNFWMETNFIPLVTIQKFEHCCEKNAQKSDLPFLVSMVVGLKYHPRNSIFQDFSNECR